jgi:uncharacterized cofD-like protein
MSLVQPPQVVARSADAPAARPALAAPRLVAIGGGTGLAVTLAGLKGALYAEPRTTGSLTAVVSVADDGGSTGRLRSAYPILAPGDIRNCLVALAEADPVLKSVFDFRFEGDGGIGGHSLGNLIITALTTLGGNFPRAVELAAGLLNIRGRVLPCTGDAVGLVAEYDDGSTVHGECRIASARRGIRRVRLEPASARALPEVLEALEAADLVVLGPGSLYTSIIPVLLVREIAEALTRRAVRVVLVANLMTEPGETDRYKVSDMVRAVLRHVPGLRIHTVVANDAPPPPSLAADYAANDASPVVIDHEALRLLGCEVVTGDLLAGEPRVRHDPVALGRVLFDLVPGKP